MNDEQLETDVTGTQVSALIHGAAALRVALVLCATMLVIAGSGLAHFHSVAALGPFVVAILLLWAALS